MPARSQQTVNRKSESTSRMTSYKRTVITIDVQKLEAGVRSLLSGPRPIVLVFACLAAFFIGKHYTPIHDAADWVGTFHYFYASIEKGVIPLWNPYSQTGTPFYTYYQPFGLLEPVNLLIALTKAVTHVRSLTAYLLDYLFRYFIFILGTYYVIKVVVSSSRTAVLFSMILACACFPMFMRQNGALNSFFLVPFITFFVLLFSKETDNGKRWFYCLVISYLCALSLTIYIPSGTLFYLALLLLSVFLFRLVRLQDIVRLLGHRTSPLWLSLSVVVAVLVALPVAALYYDFSNGNEIFPSVRILQKNGNHLVHLFASDLAADPLSTDMTNNLRVSCTIWNVVGLGLEPLIGAFREASSQEVMSEIRLYAGLFTVFCVIYAIKAGQRFAWMFLILAIAALFTATNFSQSVESQATPIQKAIITAFPLLGKVEVMQNIGALFMFCFVVVGAVGFQRLVGVTSRTIWKTMGILLSLVLIAKVAALVLVTWKFKFLIYDFQLDFLSIYHPVQILVALLGTALFFAATIWAGNYILNRLKLRNIQTAVIVIAFLDLLFFDLFHANHFQQTSLFGQQDVISKKHFRYYNRAVRREPMLDRTEGFLNYRVPLTQPRAPFHSFFGHEIYMNRKSAFPTLTGALLHAETSGVDRGTVNYDHFYMTTHYYDYLANVSLDRQAVTSNIITPIINFFPADAVCLAQSKYEVVDTINRKPGYYLAERILIENGDAKGSRSIDYTDFFDPGKYLTPDDTTAIDFADAILQERPWRVFSAYTVNRDTPNELDLTVRAPTDGYLYFGDGYSKHWKAFVDRQQAKIYRTNINFKSVYLTEGEHHVRFVYDPVFFRYSVYAYLLGNLLCLAVIITHAGRQRRPER